MWEKKRVVIVAVILFLIIGVYVIDGLYVTNQPTGLVYNYYYDVYIENVTSDFELIVPIPVLENGTAFPYFDDITLEYNNITIVNTTYGQALKITGNEDVWIQLRGSYDAIENSPDYRSDGIPILSMSNFNHTEELYDHEFSGNIWMFSNSNGIDVQLEFNSMAKSWKINRGIFHNGYVRGGTGYGFFIHEEITNGYHNYVAESGIIEVE